MKPIVFNFCFVLMFLTLAFVIPESVVAFKPTPHQIITDEGLTDFSFSKDALYEITVANTNQDLFWNQPQFHGDRYYWKDNGNWVSESHQAAFNRLREYILDQKRNIKAFLDVTPPMPKIALQCFGRALHGVQDFYSHSNYVDELTIEEQKQAKDALLDSTKNPPANLKMTGWEKDNLFGGNPSDDPLGYHHADYNKDDQDRPWYSEATGAAITHTKEFAQAVRNELTEEQWNKLITWSNATAVGGYVVPVNKFVLLAPYIGLASTILVATVATAVYVKRVKRRKEKQ